MKKNNFFTSLPFKLLVGVIIGIIAGIILNKTDGASPVSYTHLTLPTKLEV